MVLGAKINLTEKVVDAMKRFILVNGHRLINIERLLAVNIKPAEEGNHYFPDAYYLLVFDTRQVLMLSLVDGNNLMEQCQALTMPSSAGTTATISERST